MLGSLKFAVLQFADFHFPQNPRIARTPCSLQFPLFASLNYTKKNLHCECNANFFFDNFNLSDRGTLSFFLLQINEHDLT